MAEAIVQGFFEVTHVVGLEEIDEHAPCSGDARILLAAATVIGCFNRL
jgi:hypothetical protein